MDGSVGIIGVGNMGGAIARGILSGNVEFERLYLYDPDPEATSELASEDEVVVCDELGELEQTADRLVLAVKPNYVDSVLEDLAGEAPVVGSIAAGVSLEQLSAGLNGRGTVVRAMPNTPAQVGEGITFLATGPETPEQVLEDYREIFRSVGVVRVIDEQKMDAVTALTGSGPAYVMFFMEALEEAGIHQGLSPEEVAVAVRQLVRGSAELLKQRETSPGQLRREVSSPGGTTVEALKHLRETGWDGNLMEAIRKASEKSRELGQ